MLLFAEDVNISDYSNAVSLSCLDIKEAFIEYSSQRKLLFKVEMVQINRGIIRSCLRQIRNWVKRGLGCDVLGGESQVARDFLEVLLRDKVL